ncbi:40S ribosomal protein S7 [Boletus reticuloceps]|uniref:40S ribosomal protein S7 n=1 Tax=Boletus reticuloceps TaxID=495285 RepID=A0A8I2YTS5_9AGAM|nr:40S ribosomal protein S7 [Boletus reticuloceps]
MASQIGPQPAHVDFEETLASLESLPLFMKSLPSDSSDDVAIQALQRLAHDGTPDEIAQSFKDQGNDYFKGRRYREALGFYTQGLDAQPTDSTLQETLYCNRAACNLELKNYGSVLKDCSKALCINARSSKALYRSAAALLALDRLEEAQDCCDRCLVFDAHNQAVQSLRSRTESVRKAKDRQRQENEERLRREREEKQLLRIAFKERHLYPTSSPQGTLDNPYSPHFDSDDPTRSTLIFPVFFLYPQYATSDVIAHFVEDTTFYQEYTANNLVVYAMTHRRRLLKVGKKMTLRDVCKAAREKDVEPADGLEIKDGYLTFAVLPRGSEEQRWVDEFKRTKTSQSLETDHAKDIDKGVKLGPPCLSTTRSFVPANAPQTSPDETETSLAQALIDLENNVPELKAELRPLQISAAREVDVRGGKKAIVVFVPVPQLKAFHKIQQRLTRELEKKFSDRHVIFVAQRRMLSKPTRNSRTKQKRPRSRTLTSVHEKILEDLVFPTEIVGKRMRVAVDGSKLLKVILDSKDATSLEYKLDSFSSVYRRLTGKDVVFEFPPANPE